MFPLNYLLDSKDDILTLAYVGVILIFIKNCRPSGELALNSLATFNIALIIILSPKLSQIVTYNTNMYINKFLLFQ